MYDKDDKNRENFYRSCNCCKLYSRYLCRYSLWSDANAFCYISNLGLVAATYGVSWIVQPIAYYPTLGAPGSYIGWLAGSVGDIRMPAASMAQKIAGVEAGTHEGEVVGTIGTCCSIFVSASMITIFTIVGYKVIPLLPEFVTNSFNYILPALFGAIYVDIARKDIRAGGCTIAVALAIMYFGEKLVYQVDY